MTIDDLVRETGNEIGLAGLALDDNGVCGIAFDDISLTIESLPDRSRTVLYAPLGPALLAQDAAALALSALAANYFGKETAGGVIAYDEMKGNLMLWREVLPAQYATTGEFIRDLERFLAVARTWLDRVRDAQMAAPVQPEANGRQTPPVTFA